MVSVPFPSLASILTDLTPQIHARQIDDLVASSAENGFRREQAETLCLFQSDRRQWSHQGK
jgi:hypothetical protein